MKSIKRKDVIHAVQIAARDAAKTSTNPTYVEALELAARALEDNSWVMPRRRTERIKGSKEEGAAKMLIPGTVLVSDCCKAIALISESDDSKYECSKCQQPCTASQTLSGAAANRAEGDGDG